MDLFIIFVLVIFAAIVLWRSIKTIRPTERGLRERLGAYHSFLEPGVHFMIPIIDRLVRINVTEQMIDVKPQEVITEDNLNAGLDAQVYFKVRSDEESVKKSQYNVDNYQIQMPALATTTLRDIVGKLSFKDVNSMRDKLNHNLGEALDSETDAWGIEVVRTELKEITPPSDVQETMNDILKAENTKIAAVNYATAEETKADGARRAAIKEAEGRKRALILEAEGQRESDILEAEGSKQAKILVAAGEAKSIELVNTAAEKYFIGNAVELKKLQATQASLEKNTKVLMPEGMSLIDVFSTLSDTRASKSKGHTKKNKPVQQTVTKK